MNKRQMNAALAVAKSLKRCSKLGLQGGVYDGNFCLWRRDANPTPPQSGADFFKRAEEVGIIMGCDLTGMTDLDGGSGI